MAAYTGTPALGGKSGKYRSLPINCLKKVSPSCFGTNSECSTWNTGAFCNLADQTVQEVFHVEHFS